MGVQVCASVCRERGIGGKATNPCGKPCFREKQTNFALLYGVCPRAGHEWSVLVVPAMKQDLTLTAAALKRF